MADPMPQPTQHRRASAAGLSAAPADHVVSAVVDAPTEQALYLKPPEDRNAEVMEDLIERTKGLDYFSWLTEEQHHELARCWRFAFHTMGSKVCEEKEECGGSSSCCRARCSSRSSA